MKIVRPNELIVGGACIRQGALAWRKGEFPQAEAYTRRGMDILEQWRFTSTRATLDYVRGLINLGNIYRDQKHFEQALNYFTSALSLCREIQDWEGTADCENNLGLTYIEFTLSPVPKQERLIQARRHLEAAATIYERIGNESGLSSALLNIGMLVGELIGPQAARRYYSRARKHAEQAGDLFNVALATYNDGLALFLQGRIPDAVRKVRTALHTLVRQASPHYVATALAELGMMLHSAHAVPEEIVYHFAVADREFRRAIVKPLREQHSDYADTLEELEHLLGVEVFKRTWVEGKQYAVRDLLNGTSLLFRR
jgi:tetratricopeptide (TPR) repeat protein